MAPTLIFLRHNPGSAGVQLVEVPGGEAGDQAEAEEDRGQEETQHWPDEKQRGHEPLQNLQSQVFG